MASRSGNQEHDELTDIAFEKMDKSEGGWQGAAYAMIVLMMLAGGLVWVFATGSTAFIGGSSLVAMAVLGYACLLRKGPNVRYFRYFWLDHEGVHHIEGNTPTDRTAHFAWHEILHAEASAANDEFKGLILTLKRHGMNNVPVLLTMDDGIAAAAAIRAWRKRA
jgi:hypothetical protein